MVCPPKCVLAGIISSETTGPYVQPSHRERRRCVAVSSQCAVVPTAHLCKHAFSRHGVGSGRVSTHPPVGRPGDCQAVPVVVGMSLPQHLCKHASIRHDGVRRGLSPTGSHRGQRTTLAACAKSGERLLRPCPHASAYRRRWEACPRLTGMSRPSHALNRHDGRASPCRPPATKQRPAGPAPGLWAAGKHPHL